MTVRTDDTSGEKAWTLAGERMEALETALAAARHLRARAVVAMRDEGRSWAEIEAYTGLTRQRLNAIVRDCTGA